MIVFPHSPPSGGPGTFQKYFEHYLMLKGFNIEYARFGQKTPKLIFVNLGTRKILWLLFYKIKGAPIVQRLDGVNWRHAYEDYYFSKKYFRSILTNFLVAFIRKYLADVIIYQSEFVKNSWDSKYGIIKKKEVIIYNATDLDKYKPIVPEDYIINSKIKIICVEGNIQYDRFTSSIIKYLDKFCKENLSNYSIDLYGGYDSRLYQFINVNKINVSLNGKVTSETIANEMRNSDIYFTLELYPPCPNSVIEALSSGLAIAGYDTGSLHELINNDCGVLFNTFEEKDLPNSQPDYDEFFSKMKLLIENFKVMKKNSRKLALKRFNKEVMLNEYFSLIRNCLNI